MRSITAQFVVFSGVGAVGTSAHYLVLIACVELELLRPEIATMLGYLAGMILNYLLNYRFTFRSRQAHRTSAGRYLMVSFVGFWLNAVLMAVLTRHTFYLLSQVMATSVVLLWNFACSRYWVFGRPEE